MADAQIAAICRHCSVGLATSNVEDFANTGVDAVNPWDSGDFQL
jgi:predicted nucleic acid-binding protein